MSTPDVASFDDWYRALDASGRRDDVVRRWLDLPPEVQSTGYLSGPGLVEVLDRLGLAPGDTLVELGCGRGGYGMAAARASGARLVGIDFSAVAVAAARRQATHLQLDDVAEFRVGDLTASGLATGSADAVLVVDAFHFATPSSAAGECRRLLRPGGRLVVTSWEPTDLGDPALPGRLRHQDVGRALAAAGLVDVEVSARPAWSGVEHALWAAAVTIDPAGDPALADLVEEAEEMLPLAARLRRVLVTARTPSTTPG